MEILLLASCGVYIACTLLIFIGLGRLKRRHSSNQPFVSVIVAARNEAQNTEAFLNSILEQDYPRERFELVLVDDQSEDDTYQTAKSLLQRESGFDYKLISVSSDNPEVTEESATAVGVKAAAAQIELCGKKRALTCAIRASKGEILLFTDADCKVPRGWIGSVVSHFDPSVDIVAGFTFREHGRSLSRKLYSLESIATSTIAAGSIGWGYPITGSGSNLAYRRELFDQLGGYRDISSKASGDDTLLLQRASAIKGATASYMTSPDSFVTTEAPNSLRQIVNQRRRRFSTTPSFSPPLLLLSGVVFLFYSLLVLAPLGLFIAPRFFGLGLLCLGAKSLIDLLALHKSTRLFRKRYLLKYLPVLELVYPPLFIYCATAALIAPTDWKGRRS